MVKEISLRSQELQQSDKFSLTLKKKKKKKKKKKSEYQIHRLCAPSHRDKSGK